ncbi:hypothetical protein TRFO_30187 [Tritrichomonas foetus]|uniref:TOG domain-containing protein n=1 Tax=Tritrichomonas foetus TaxID=1144522 RepID=A0A1J4JW74_9EUKA|nr:hypothetical protein TRFO_30187 [Tritrichomonas foetus]|eukprot:OHT02688.1 hypothetical protein TRFO_30187 [Tritrichomonas foetus]
MLAQSQRFRPTTFTKTYRTLTKPSLHETIDDTPNKPKIPNINNFIEVSNLVEELKTIEEQMSPKIKYDIRIMAMNRLLSLISSGILNDQRRSQIVIQKVKHLYDGIVASLLNIRNTSIKTACALIVQLAIQLGDKFEDIGNYVKPLTKQAIQNFPSFNSNQSLGLNKDYSIYNTYSGTTDNKLNNNNVFECCRNALFTISQFCCTLKIMNQIIILTNTKSTQQRMIIAEVLNIFVASATPEIIENGWNNLSKALLSLILDKNNEIRSFACKAIKQFKTQSHDHYEEILNSNLDPKLKKVIINEEIFTLKDMVQKVNPKVNQKSEQKSNQIKDVNQISTEQIKSADITAIIKPQTEQIDSKKSASESDIMKPTPKQEIIRHYRSPSVTDYRNRTMPMPKPSIRQANGHGRVFLSTVRELIGNGEFEELSSNIDNIVDDVIKCCSLQILAVSAISVLRSLLPHYSRAIEKKLNQIIPILLNQASKGSARASTNAMKVLHELATYFPADSLIKATISSPPSPRLSLFAAFLVDSSMKSLELHSKYEKEKDQTSQNNLLSKISFDETYICDCLLSIAFESYQMDIKSAALIVDAINKNNPDSINSFLSNLDDKSFYSFQKSMKELLPDVCFPPVRPVHLPEFEPNDPDWPHKFVTFVENLYSFQWKMVHTKVYYIINQSMMASFNDSSAHSLNGSFDNSLNHSSDNASDVSDIQSTVDSSQLFKLAIRLIQQRGFDDIEEILPGVFKNLRKEKYSKDAQNILILFYKLCDILLVFAEFEVMMASTDYDIAINAIDFSRLLIKGMKKDTLKPILPELCLTLSELMSSEIPEVRKAVVLCFVSIFTVVGTDEVDQYTKELSVAQKKLIMIYLEKMVKSSH